MESIIELFGNRAYFYIAVSAILLLVDLFALGFSGILMFGAIGALATSAFVFLTGSSDFLIELLFWSVSTVVSSFVLWKPLKKLQNSTNQEDTSSDMIGKVVVVTEEITMTSGKIRFTGIDWVARNKNPTSPHIDLDTEVKIVGVDGTIMLVEKV